MVSMHTNADCINSARAGDSRRRHMDFAGFSVNLVERVENVELVKELTALLYKNVLEWP